MRNKKNTKPHIYEGVYLTGIDLPVGPIGAGPIRMNGKAERERWHIFNNRIESEGSGEVPNSFFAIGFRWKDNKLVRLLQTSCIGPFTGMDSLTFQGEYPFGWYTFHEPSMPASVRMEVYNPLIPMDLKNSSIPCAFFGIIIKNLSPFPIEAGVLAAQQNAVGYDGYLPIRGDKRRENPGFTGNCNRVFEKSGKTVLSMTGNGGSMALAAYETEMSFTASWSTLETLYDEFSTNFSVTGSDLTVSQERGITVDGALAKSVLLAPGEERKITFILSWYFPQGKFGYSESPSWSFEGCMYENWWENAEDVDRYVQLNYKYLDLYTRKFHDTFYSSSIPRYILDRITSQLSVLRSPTAFWAKNGYFGLWESTSTDKVGWTGNCKHVYHYAQTYARLFPELGKKLRIQDLNTQTEEGLLPARDDQMAVALDGHLGTILAIYREHLLSVDSSWLASIWQQVKKAMDFVISTFDPDENGMLSGSYHNTLDCNISGTSSWIGSLYLAALKASAVMAEIIGDTITSNWYNKILLIGISNQDTHLWNEKLKYYVEKSENLPETKVMQHACSIDMLLGQWWANQLNLGQIYPTNKTVACLAAIFNNNRVYDDGYGSYASCYRDFLGRGDTGWIMFKFPWHIPKNCILYHSEVMSGFEYSAAAIMLQYGMNREGMTILKAIADRYDGRLRDGHEVTVEPNATVFGTGSPFGEDECGDFYGRPMSSWSVLLALQGFIFDGPQQSIGFKPNWTRKNHRSFFSTSEGWGLFTQRQTKNSQTVCIDLIYGRVSLKKIMIQLPEEKNSENVVLKLNDYQIGVSAIQSKNMLIIEADHSLHLFENSSIKIICNYS